MKKLLLLLLLNPVVTLAADYLQPELPPQSRDPFSASSKMHASVGLQNNQLNPFGQFTPGYGAQTVPKMRLKGFVTKNRKRATALLDVEGAGVYMVSKGDQIGLHAIGLNTVLEVVDISSNGVKVRTGQVNQVIVVR